MSRRALPPRADVCQLCDFMMARYQSPVRPQRFFQSRALTTRRNYAQASKTMSSPTHPSTKPASIPVDTKVRIAPSELSSAKLEEMLSRVRTACTAIMSPEHVPSEKAVLQALGKCNALVEFLAFDSPPTTPAAKDGAASALLSLDEASTKKSSSPNPSEAIRHTLDLLSRTAYSVIKYPTVFITPRILELYVKIQSGLGKPESFPELFQMYGRKPLPQKGTPIKYAEQNPNKIANAVSAATADRALQTAIDARQLPAAMGIVESAYATVAFRRSKFFHRGLLPATGVAVAPVAAYTVASSLANLQTTMDSSMATSVAFAGIMAYTLFTGTIGVVAITTANDQMDRVTWAPGIPLRQRWIREEERHAIDKIAAAWGFKETWRRGEEEGEDWDTLREWIGGKGMMLDRVELMEGME